MTDETVSIRVQISGAPFAPQDAIRSLLSAVGQALGLYYLGHIKGAARFPDGSLFASTVGTPPDVNFRAFGYVPGTVEEMVFQLTCIVYGATGSTLKQAVKQGLEAMPSNYIIEGEFSDTDYQH